MLSFIIFSYWVTLLTSFAVYYSSSDLFIHFIISGLAIKLGGCVAAWHNGYTIGVWEYFIAFMLVAVGYLSLNLCVAELTSITSFPGDYYDEEFLFLSAQRLTLS